MNEYDSPNFAEYVYDRKNEGKVKIMKSVAIAVYVLFAAGIFAVLCALQLFWFVAVLPIFTWMLVYFTWGFISYDYYYEFKHGEMEFGAVRQSKNGRRRRPMLKLSVKAATLAKVYSEDDAKHLATKSSAAANGNDKAVETALPAVEKLYDFSESKSSDKRIILYFNDGGKSAAVIFEGTARIAKLIASFCQNGASLKGAQLHG